MFESFAAGQIALYINAGVIEGQGGARIDLGNRRSAQADAFAYDLRTGRLVLAGHVDLVDRSGRTANELRAAVVVRTPNGTLYALVTTPTPRRERLDATTLAPVDDQAPGNAFAFPNVSEAPWMVADSADVVPGTLVTLRHATFLYPTRGATLPSYVYVFSPNTYYATSTLPYASFDQAWPFRGGAHALDTLHVRYDQSAGASLGFDHRAVFGDRAYALLSLAPLTQSGRNASFTFYQRMSSHVYQTFNADAYRQGPLIQRPDRANASLSYAVTDALRQSYVQLTLNQSYDSLVAGGTPNHPNTELLSWYGNDHPLGRTGFRYRLHSSIGHDHDAFGLGGQIAPAAATDAWVKGTGLSLSSPVVTLPLKIQLSAYGERDLSWFSTGPGHGYLTNDLVLTAARHMSPRLSAVATYQLLEASSPFTLFRTAALNLTYDAPARAQVVLSLQHDDDVNAVRPLYAASIDVRMRLARLGTIEIGRSYFFNFGGQTWSPRFTFSFLP